MDVAELAGAVSEALSTPIEILGPTARGESGATFDVRLGTIDAVLKLVADGPSVFENQERLVALIDSLRARGYPAPEYLAVGRLPGNVCTVQRRLPGRTLEAAPGRVVDADLLAALLPQLLDAVELQADAGDLAHPPWPTWLLDTIRNGGDGYCLHDTMRERRDTASILDRVLRLADGVERPVPRRTDIVHFDFNPANILHEDAQLSGVVDWNVPFAGAMQGDRGFDLATLLFYTYDIDATRDRLWQATVATSGAEWTVVYLAHLVLRQVEWTVRHRPHSDEETRFIGIALRVLDDSDTLIA